MTMAKYRITEVTFQPEGYKKYLVQKRFLGFLWWYDPYDDGLYSDGYFDTYDKALETVTHHIAYKEEKKVVWTSE